MKHPIFDADASGAPASVLVCHEAGRRGGAPWAASEFAAGWPALLGGFLGCAVGVAALGLYSLAFLAGPIAAEFGWQRTDVTTASTAYMAGLALVGPLVGRLCGRWGARTVTMLSAALYAAMLGAMALFAGSITTFYLGYFAIAALGAGTAYAAYARVVSGWFNRRRGIALAIMTSGPGMSAALIPFALPAVINAHGWRTGYAALAGAALLAVPIAFWLLREPADPADGAAPRERPADGLTLSEALRTRQFWAITFGLLIGAAAVSGISINIVDVLERQGAAPLLIRTAASTFGLSCILGRIIIGLALDRFNGALVGGGLFVFAAVSMLLFDGGGSWPVVFAAALTLGLASGAEGDICAYLATRHFGLRAYSEIYGWIFTASAVGLAAGTTTARWLVQATGSYHGFLLLASGTSIVAALLFATLGRYRYGDAAPAPDHRSDR